MKGSVTGPPGEENYPCGRARQLAGLVSCDLTQQGISQRLYQLLEDAPREREGKTKLFSDIQQ